MTRTRRKDPDFLTELSRLYPGFVEIVRRVIEKSEEDFEGQSGGKNRGFLWEHTLHVASLSYDLALAEGIDPVLSSIVALFHDSGKFAGGTYHQGRRPEEEAAAKVAERLLRKAGMKKRERGRVQQALRALYSDKAAKSRLAAVVHDADFLSKFGYIGVAGFFIKSTLRGRNLHGAIMNSLSKELTYALALPRNMRTEAGRKLAGRKSRNSLKFFRALLRELREAHGSNFRIRKLNVALPDRPGKIIEVHLVIPVACEICGESWKIGFFIDEGVKCRRLNAGLSCVRGDNKYEISFCLPEISATAERRPA